MGYILKEVFIFSSRHKRINIRELLGKRVHSQVKFRTLFVLEKMLVIRAGIHKMHVRIANREDPDHTVSSEAV